MKHYLISTAFIFSFAACGGSDLDPGSGNDPGEGTSTLFIDGNASAEPRLTNARARGDFDTHFSVRVRTLAGADVTEGTVSITSASGTVPLIYNPNGEVHRWEGTASGYDEVYVLDVDSGADYVHGVRVDGPDIHYFTEPLPGATVDSTMQLEIKWSSDDAAPSAWIRAERIDDLSIPDSGTYMLSAGALKAEKDKAQENTLRLSRADRVTPAGAAGGSELTVSVRNELGVVAMPNPAL
jgi:hypothetical protein